MLFVSADTSCEQAVYQTSHLRSDLLASPLELELCTFYNTIARDTPEYAFVSYKYADDKIRLECKL